MVFNKTSEIKEIIDVYLVNAYEDGQNVVLIDKHDDDNVIIFSNNLRYKWKEDNLDSIGLHMRDRENNIEIKIMSIEECPEDLDVLISDNRWIFSLM